MKNEFSQELKFALNVAKEAGEQILKLSISEINTDIKTINDSIVTNVDILADKFIISRLKMEYPNDGFLTEESKDDLSRLNKKRVWIIDPIDGTNNFKNYALSKNKDKDYQYFGIHIGLVINKKVFLGVVYNPPTKEIFFAETGKGSYKMIDKRIKKLKISNKLSRYIHISKSMYDNPKWKSFTEKIPFRSDYNRTLGYYIVKIAENKVDAFANYPRIVNRMGEWDVCAPSIILEEAGGIITDFNGRKFTFNNKNPYLSNGILAQKRKGIVSINNLFI